MKTDDTDARFGALRAVLTAHAARHPYMTPCDAVKLLYQQEFGGGHLIADPARSLARLRAEWDAVSFDPAAELLEDIGEGVVRVQLAALTPELCTPERLNELFVRSAAAHRGSHVRFAAKLAWLERHHGECGFAFSDAALRDWLTDYRVRGCSAVSHSEVYRAAAHPAYRIVLASLWDR